MVHIDDDTLTLAINVLRDVADSRRMPSGVVVTEVVAASHQNAAEELERVRATLRTVKSLEVFQEEDSLHTLAPSLNAMREHFHQHSGIHQGREVAMTQSEKDNVLREFRAKMRRVRDSQPAEAQIEDVKNATLRLLAVAEGDTGQSWRCANFLLAWWNAQECGGFDLTDMWKVDFELAQDMVTVFSVVANWQHYPDSQKLGLGKECQKRFECLAKERIAARQEAKK
jgi:predicted Fe-S protein YdhL (DUF1289 family)